jgi:hypothetical protein
MTKIIHGVRPSRLSAEDRAKTLIRRRFRHGRDVDFYRKRARSLAAHFVRPARTL